MTQGDVDTCYEWRPLKLLTISNIHSYHHYQSIWMPGLGESLLCEREPTNFNDRYEAVSVVKGDIIVGHLSRVISQICWPFLLRNGTIDSYCTVTGAKNLNGIIFIAKKCSRGSNTFVNLVCSGCKS